MKEERRWIVPDSPTRPPNFQGAVALMFPLSRRERVSIFRSFPKRPSFSLLPIAGLISVGCLVSCMVSPTPVRMEPPPRVERRPYSVSAKTPTPSVLSSQAALLPAASQQIPPVGGPAADALVTTAGAGLLLSPAADSTTQSLADLLYRIVAATEEHEPRLGKRDSDLAQLDAEMKDIRFSVGWEVELVKRETEFDATRHAIRKGTTLGLDGRPRRAYDLRGHYSREEDELIVRLRRSFLGPDHEKYVKIAERQVEKMGIVLEKQAIRRGIHLATIQAVLEILHFQTVLPLIEQQISLAQNEAKILEKFQKAGEALRKDVLAAQKQVVLLEEQRLSYRNLIRQRLAELRQKSGSRDLTVPGTLPSVAALPSPPTSLNEEELTSEVLVSREDYVIAQERLRLGEHMATHLAWYLPRVDFEAAWNDYSDDRRFLDTRRTDEGNQFSTELTLNVPLNLPYRGLKRREQYRAQQTGFLFDMEEMRATVANEILRAHVDWQQAFLRCRATSASLAAALEEERQTRLTVKHMPVEVQGIAEIKEIEAQLRVLEARAACAGAEYTLWNAQARWDYQTGSSPIDEAVGPYAERDRRAAERKGWLQWWTSLIR